MKIENIEEVNRLYKIIANIQKAMKELIDKSEAYKRPDVYKDQPQETNIGYSACISQHSDGSGAQINLSGCYVGAELIDATKTILENKFTLVRHKISLYGVDVTNLALED